MYYIYAKFKGQRKFAALNLEDGQPVAELKNATGFENHKKAQEKIAMLMQIYHTAEFKIEMAEDLF